MVTRPASRYVLLFRLLTMAGLSLGGSVKAEPIISEIMASNVKSLADDDGAFSDWIEIFNPDPLPVDLGGWYLTDNASAKTKWQFPAVTLNSGGTLVVFASNKNRRDPSRLLHTNFALSAGGEYMGLIKPDGATVASEFAPTFPAQFDDVSYGLTSSLGGKTATIGFFRRATPGAVNGDAGTLMLLEQAGFSREARPFAANFQLEMTGAAPDQHLRYVVAPSGPAGANVAEPTATSTLYTGPITVDSSVIVRAAVFSSDDSVQGRSATVHYVRMGASAATFSSHLPVLLLDNHGFGPLVKDGVDHPSWLYTYAVREPGVPVFSTEPDLATRLTSSVRGSSSADFPKKGYNLKLNDNAGKKLAQPIFNSSRYEKWALVASWNYDRTHIHNSFAYSLSNRIGRWAPRTYLTEVFFNNSGGDLEAADYAGIFTLTDRVEVGDGRVAINALSAADVTAPAITGGYILKIDLQDDDEYAWITNRGVPDNGYSSVVLAYPKADDLAPAQRDYIRGYVQKMEDALFADAATNWGTRTYLNYLDRSSWVDHHMLNTMMGNLDAFQRSAYFTKNRGGKLIAGPLWDFDRSMGSTDPREEGPEGWLGSANSHNVWTFGWWSVLTTDPEFMQDWIDRWQTLRRDEFSNANLRALADLPADSIGPAAAARDAARWPDNLSRFGDHAGEVANMKNWLTRRAGWIDQQFVAPPQIALAGTSLRVTPAPGAQLAYTLDGSDPRALGGELAPNALLTSSPLLVPADANLHARSYRADLKNIYPNSPFSSSIGGEASSPLAPVARLINLSSRAIIGNGEDILISGVVVADTVNKRYLSRAIGPGLAMFGTSGILADPSLSIFTGKGAEIYRNSGWQNGSNAAELAQLAKSVGAFPLTTGSADSALTAEISNGSYSLHVHSPTAQSGIGLAEFYELDDSGRTLNLSSRAVVRAGDGALIGGFVVRGPAYKRLLIRAIGPTLRSFGITQPLLDPSLEIYAGQTIVGSNDRWSAVGGGTVIEAATKSVGAFTLPPGSEDAALLVTLPPGAYTVKVTGKGGGEGVALLEIYDVP